MYLKSQILWNSLALLNHPRQNQMPTRFPQFPFRSISTNFHLPVHCRRSWPNPPPPQPQPHTLNMSSLASPNPPPESSAPRKTVKVVVAGRVQGVFYRNWTVENATELGLKGWVRNRGDGSVEALFSGDADKVDEMQERCRRGPALAVVTKHVVTPSDENPGTGFERRPSV